jgi:uncharacterized protein (DUF2336 family)
MSPAIEPAKGHETKELAALSGLLDAVEALARRNVQALFAVGDPNLLAFLGGRGGPATRRAVAANRAAPAATDLRLAGDPDETVRCEIARKISWRLSSPAVSPEFHEILESLSDDPAVHVRATLAHEVRHLCLLPRKIARRLLNDSQADVVGPIVECSPLVSDGDLIAAVFRMADAETLMRVARRRPVSPDVADAVIIFFEPNSISALLENPDAEIRSSSLDRIAARADVVAFCLDALAKRSDLSPQAQHDIAVVAAMHADERLADMSDIGARIDVERARLEGLLDEGFIRTAANDGKLLHVAEGLARIADLQASAVRTVIESGSERGIVALVRRAGLNMRTAYRILEAIQRARRTRVAPNATASFRRPPIAA